MSLREAAERLLERWTSQQDMDNYAGAALFEDLRAALAEAEDKRRNVEASEAFEWIVREAWSADPTMPDGMNEKVELVRYALAEAEPETGTYLDQIAEAKRDTEQWPQWMKDAAQVSAAVPPKQGGRLDESDFLAVLAFLQGSRGNHGRGGRTMSTHEHDKPKGWIGVDLDGTLAHYDRWVGATHIGEPIRPMLQRVRDWLHDGEDVRIVTARVSHDGSAARMIEAQHALIAIMDWCERYVGRTLPVTCVKDYAMKELWDDRAVQVEKNIGEPVGYSTRGMR